MYSIFTIFSNHIYIAHIMFLIYTCVCIHTHTYACITMTTNSNLFCMPYFDLALYQPHHHRALSITPHAQYPALVLNFLHPCDSGRRKLQKGSGVTLRGIRWSLRQPVMRSLHHVLYHWYPFISLWLISRDFVIILSSFYPFLNTTQGRLAVTLSRRTWTA